jgi:alpha-L-fucosidase
LQPDAVIFNMGPDVRWVGNESGLARESEWSVIPKQHMLAHRMPDLGHRKYLAEADELVWYPAECDVSIRPGWFYHASQDNQVKSLKQLVEIYYRSVGRNSVLLLNIPPDRRGLFHENDVARLRQLRAVLDETFKTNLAAGRPVTASNTRKGHTADFVTDGNGDTYWTSAENTLAPSLVVDLGRPMTFDRAMIQEMISQGQRVERFKLEGAKARGWQPIVEATTIGYKRLLRFPEVTTDRVRITILESRDCPTIREFGLCKASPKETAE